MKHKTTTLIHYLAISLIILFLTSCDDCSKHSDCSKTVFTGEPFPHNKYYPISADTLESWVKNREGEKTREHGWALFNGLMSKPADNSRAWLWLTWPTATQAYATDQSKGAEYNRNSAGGTKAQEISFLNAVKKTDSIELSPPAYKVPGFVCKILNEDTNTTDGCTVPLNGCRFQNNGDVLIAGVVYDQTAFDHIRNNKLYDWETLVSMWTNSYTQKDWSQRSIPEFPSSSFVLKPMLWPVKQQGYTPLPIYPLSCYDGTTGCDLVNGTLRYSGLEIQRVWDKAVAITADANPPKNIASIDFLHNVYTNDSYSTPIPTSTFNNVEVHGLDEFYYWQVSEEEWNTMDCADKAIISQSAYWIYGEEFKPGDYLALVAMHVITKEMPSWTLQSFWWDNTAQVKQYPKYAQGRSSITGTPAAFSSYLMTSTYGMNAIHVDSTEWPVAYNPYIELAAAHPIQTNCRNCHQRGAFPNKGHRAIVDSSLKNFAAYLRHRNGDPSALDTFDMNNAVLDSLLITDFQWAITDRVTPTK